MLCFCSHNIMKIMSQWGTAGQKTLSWISLWPKARGLWLEENQHFWKKQPMGGEKRDSRLIFGQIYTVIFEFVVVRLSPYWQLFIDFGLTLYCKVIWKGWKIQRMRTSYRLSLITTKSYFNTWEKCPHPTLGWYSAPTPSISWSCAAETLGNITQKIHPIPHTATHTFY